MEARPGAARFADRHSRPAALTSDLGAGGPSVGAEEIEAVRDALINGALSGSGGRWVTLLEHCFARAMGTRFAIATSSGSSAVHAAIAVIDPEPGEEIVVSPVAEPDVLMPILFQGAIPVFADIDPLTGNLTADTIRPRLADRTRAILVTHQLGQPCDMEPIMSLAAARRLPVIEDCSQALMAETSGSFVGAIGALGCFDLGQDRHVSCGEGGLVVTANEELAERASRFVHKKAESKDGSGDRGLALESRMTELQGAVATVQVRKLWHVVEDRVARATELIELLADLSGITLPAIPEGVVHSFWKFPIRAHGDQIEGGAPALAREIRARGGVASLLGKPAFRHSVFSSRKTFGESGYPLSIARAEAVDYRDELYPGTLRYLRDMLVLPIDGRFSQAEVSRVAKAVREAVAQLSKGGTR